MPSFDQMMITTRPSGSKSERLDICTSYKSRRDGTIHKSCRRPNPSDEGNPCGRLTKPPKVPYHKLPSSRRLQKKRKPISRPAQLPPSPMYILTFEPYPYNTVPAIVLGVFSNIDTVTSAAFHHGAYAFSREGLHDGSEYLTPNGRIRIFPEEKHDVSLEAAKSPSPRQEDYIPHPDDHVEAHRQDEARKTAFVALGQTSSKTSCIGLFGEKMEAWNACVKEQSVATSLGILLEETRWSDEHGMPYIRTEVEGSGSLLWFVSAFEVDRLVL